MVAQLTRAHQSPSMTFMFTFVRIKIEKIRTKRTIHLCPGAFAGQSVHPILICHLFA